MSTATELREQATVIAETAPLVEWKHPSLAAALVAALAEITVVEKGRKAKIPTKDGGSYSYDFADIADVVKLTRPVLSKHGLVALTPIHAHDAGLACTVKIVHEGGEVLDLGPFTFPHGRDAQSTGSAVTYHRRYALVAALGIAAGDDDDGAAATRSANQPAPVEWNAGMVKARLVELTGSKDAAKDAWERHGGPSLTVFSAAAADAIFESWENEDPRENSTGEVGGGASSDKTAPSDVAPAPVEEPEGESA